MKMIIGGAHQGKLDYGKEMFPEIQFLDGATCDLRDIMFCQGIYNFHLFIKRTMEAEIMPGLAQFIYDINPDLVIITDEIGYGIVPADPFLREYRETTGRICTELASLSEEVYRVMLGVGTRIK